MDKLARLKAALLVMTSEELRLVEWFIDVLAKGQHQSISIEVKYWH